MAAIADPMERLIADALDGAGIAWRHDSDGQTDGLDFFLPDLGLHIEVKRFHSARIAGQMARAPNVIAVQGEAAVRLLAQLIASAGPAAFDRLR